MPPLSPQNTCSPETRFITFRAAVYVEPPVIALETCITLTFSLTNISSYSTTKQSWLPRNRVENSYISVYVCAWVYNNEQHTHSSIWLIYNNTSRSMQIALPCLLRRLYGDRCGCEESHTQTPLSHRYIYTTPLQIPLVWMLILEPLALDLTWLWYARATGKCWLHNLLLKLPSQLLQRGVILLQVQEDQSVCTSKHSRFKSSAPKP